MKLPDEIRISYDGESLPKFNKVLKKKMWKLGFGAGSLSNGVDTTNLLFIRIVKIVYSYWQGDITSSTKNNPDGPCDTIRRL